MDLFWTSSYYYQCSYNFDEDCDSFSSANELHWPNYSGVGLRLSSHWLIWRLLRMQLEGRLGA